MTPTLLANRYELGEESIPGLGIADLETVREPGPRLIGNVAIETDLGDGPRVLAGFDEELLEQRGIPPEVVDPLGALLLAPGTLAALGVAEGDLVGVRLTAQGLVVERVTAPPRSPGVGAAVGGRLAATLDADEPVYFDAAVWTACDPEPTSRLISGVGRPRSVNSRSFSEK